MDREGIEKWLVDNNLENNALRTDENHRVSLYLSDVLGSFYDDVKKHEVDSNNAIDAAYVLGVFNASGVDGLSVELKRLKELNTKPHVFVKNILK